jgi:F-type H+-transporting ATPase subunit delta
MEKISEVYASAVFDLAVGRGAVDECLEQTTLLRDTLEDAECLRVFVHTHVREAEKREMFVKPFVGKLGPELIGLVDLVIDKNREQYLPDALTALVTLIEQYQQKVVAKVTSAAPLDEKQIAGMSQVLSKKLGKNVEVDLTVEPSVIGGPYISVDGRYIDRTLKKRLHDLASNMKEGCGA